MFKKESKIMYKVVHFRQNDASRESFCNIVSNHLLIADIGTRGSDVELSRAKLAT